MTRRAHSPGICPHPASSSTISWSVSLGVSYPLALLNREGEEASGALVFTGLGAQIYIQLSPECHSLLQSLHRLPVTPSMKTRL